MPYLPASLLLLGGLICILGGLYLIQKELQLADAAGEEGENDGDLVARIGRVLKLDVSNYGPGVIALLLGGGILLAGPYLYDIQYAGRVDELNSKIRSMQDSLRRVTEVLEVEGVVRKEGGEQHDDITVYPRFPIEQPTEAGKLESIEVWRGGPDLELPSIAFTHENYGQRVVDLDDSDEARIQGDKIKIHPDTIVLGEQ